MKNSELRIKNYVHSSRENKDIQLTGNDIFMHNREVEFEPILISESWLLKFGFIRQPWGLVKGPLLFKDQNHECKVLTLEVGNGFRTTVYYVHQLQNLYFTLTGAELCTQ